MNTTANNTEPSMPLVITCMQVAGNTSKNGKNKTTSFKTKKKPVKSKLNTQKTFKTLENEWKPRNTPVGAMEQANNTPRKTESKKKSQNAEKQIPK
jgi:hypothetical protein